MPVDTGDSGGNRDSSPRLGRVTAVPIDPVVLEQECIRRGWSWKELSRKSGVAEKTIWNIRERGHASAAVLGRLRTALEATPPSELAQRLIGEPTQGAA